MDNFNNKTGSKFKNESDRIYGYWGVVKAFAYVSFISVVSYKVLVTPVDFVLDFPTLLSLLLAFFSVGLSALFYFKATETSNNFYDNTHKFTRDISQLLSKMESGFGERLKHLDEGYSSVRDYLQNGNSISTNEKLEEDLKNEVEQVRKTAAEKQEMIDNLIEKAHLDGEEKNTYINLFKLKEQELDESKAELNKLINLQKRESNINFSKSANYLLDSEVFKVYLHESIVRHLEDSLIFKPISRDALNEKLKDLLTKVNNSLIKDLRKYQVLNGDFKLTHFGYEYFYELALEKSF